MQDNGKHVFFRGKIRVVEVRGNTIHSTVNLMPQEGNIVFWLDVKV